MDTSLIESIINEKYKSNKKHGFLNIQKLLHHTIEGYE
jgi:hypothetical protein